MEKSTHTKYLAPIINLRSTMILRLCQGKSLPVLLFQVEIRNKNICRNSKAKKDNRELHLNDYTVHSNTNLSEFSEHNCVQEVLSTSSSSSDWSTLAKNEDSEWNVSWKEWKPITYNIVIWLKFVHIFGEEKS